MAGVSNGRGLDLNNIAADEVLVAGSPGSVSAAYVKAEVGEKLYKIDGKAYAVIKFSDACVSTMTETETQWPSAFIGWAAAIEQTEAVSKGGSSGTSTSNQSKFICGVPQSAFLDQASKGVSAADMNDRRLFPAAVFPTAAAIPMRSNIDTYGPYVSANFTTSPGGTIVEQNPDLAPWVFGGETPMNIAGNALANSYTTGLNQSESGSATIAGLPQLPFMGLITNGPSLTGINVSFGTSGVTTNYSFQTFTPKFGGLTRAAIENMKNMARNRQKQLQFLRNQAIMAHNINRKLTRVRGGINKNAENKNSIAHAQTLQRVFVGEMFDWYNQDSGKSQRTVVGTDTLSKSVLELRYDYEKKAFISFDGLFGPVSKSGGGGSNKLPRYATFNENLPLIKRTKGSPLAPHPPFAINGSCDNSITMDQYNLPINRKYADPLTNKVTQNNHHHDGNGAGHAIDMLGRDQEIPKDGMLMNLLPKDDDNRYSEDYRFLGLRGPLVLHAWGYDTDGKPVPNAADTDSSASDGNFKQENLKDKFLKDWLNKPRTWPVAPVDLRFDRERGMWVSPQAYKIVVGRIVKKVEAFGEGRAILVNTKDGNKYYKDLYDENGNKIAGVDPGKSASCDQFKTEEDEEKQYKWILINAGKCEKKYYCYSIGGNSTMCRQSNAMGPDGEPGFYNDPEKGLLPPMDGPFASCDQNPCKQYGACCYDSGYNFECVDFVERQDCLDYYQGEFTLETENGLCETIGSSCKQEGACCYYDNDNGTFYGCDENIPRKICELDGGIHWLGAKCVDAPCYKKESTTDTGACCYDTGYGRACDINVTKQDCLDYYEGVSYPGLTCDDVDYLCQRKGACCYYDKDTGESYGCDSGIPEWDCNNDSGVHHFGVTCNETYCPENCCTSTTSSATTTTGVSTTGDISTTGQPAQCDISDACIDQIFDKVWAKILAQSTYCNQTSTTGGPTTTGPTTTTTPTTTTGGPRVPGPPTNLSAVVVPANNRNVSVTWSAPTDKGVPPTITGYKVTYDSGSNPITVSGTSTTISDLMPGQTYTITVVAINATGEGSPATTSITINGWCCVYDGTKYACKDGTSCLQSKKLYESETKCEETCSQSTSTSTTFRPTTSTTTTSTRPPRTQPPTPPPPPKQPEVPTISPGSTEPPPTPPPASGGGTGVGGSDQAMVIVVDRIGRELNPGSLVYLYYDTYKSEYIALDHYTEQSAPMIFGQWNGQTIKVEGTTGLSGEDKINIGSVVPVENTMNLELPDAQHCTVRAVAVKFLMTSNGKFDPTAPTYITS